MCTLAYIGEKMRLEWRTNTLETGIPANFLKHHFFKKKKKNMVKTSTFNVTTIHIIRGNYHPARLSRESAMYREWWFWWKTSHCNTMQKQTHYEYYYFNKLIQVYKARKSNIAFTRLFQHSTILSWSSGCVQNLIKVFKSTQSFSDRGLS